MYEYEHILSKIYLFFHLRTLIFIQIDDYCIEDKSIMVIKR